MSTDVTATRILNRLEWLDVVLILALLLGGKLVSVSASWLIRRLAERAPGRWRLPILQLMPIARLLIMVAALMIIVPMLIQPTLQNVVTLMAGIGLALAFALKDLGSAAVAGLVTIFERVYQPGDWIEVDGTYGEVHSIGLRAVRVVTLDDTAVIIPHTKLWTTSIANASAGNRHLLCVTNFYLDPHHDGARVRQALETVAAGSAYRLRDSGIKVIVEETPWGTHYAVKAYVRESRDQASITSDITVRGKAVLLGMGIKAARVPVSDAGA